jgi:hypothetical protein
MGGWDPITPLKPHLGPGFSALVTRLQAAVNHRYDLPAWTPDDYAEHKRADRCELARNNDPLRGVFRVQSRPL